MDLATYSLSSGLDVTVCGVPALMRAFGIALDGGSPVHVCTVNPEILVRCNRDQAYLRAVRGAQVRTIDGIGISMAVCRQHGIFPPRLTGVALTRAALDWARDEGRPVMIVGSTDLTRRIAEARMRKEGVQVVPGCSPKVTARGGSDPIPELPWGGVVLVALGAPKQEFWIRRCLDRGAPPNVYIGNGGAIDYYAGAVQLAPHWIRRVGLEWLYRLIRQPRLRLERQAGTIPEFLWNQVMFPRSRRPAWAASHRAPDLFWDALCHPAPIRALGEERPAA